MASRLVYLVNGFFIMLMAGTVYSYSIFRKPIEEYLNISASQSALPFKIFLLLFAFSMPLSGYIIEKNGVRKTYIIGSVIIVLSWISSYFINSLWCFVFTYGILGGIGTGIIYGVPLKVVSLWFSDMKGIATGITVAGFGLSSFVVSQILKVFIIKYGILNSFMYFGIIVFFVLFLCYFYVKIPEQSFDKKIYHTGYETSDVLKDKRFYIVYMFFLTATSFSLTSVSFTATYFIDFLNFDINKASNIVSFMAILNATGRPVFGYITDRYGFVVSIYISFLMYLISSLILIFSPYSIYFIIVAFMILWFNLGGWLSIAPVSTMRFFGLLHYAKNYGIIYTAYGIGAFLGMNIMHYFNYKVFFYYISVSSLVILIFTFTNYKKISYEY